MRQDEGDVNPAAPHFARIGRENRRASRLRRIPRGRAAGLPAGRGAGLRADSASQRLLDRFDHFDDFVFVPEFFGDLEDEEGPAVFPGEVTADLPEFLAGLFVFSLGEFKL